MTETCIAVTLHQLLPDDSFICSCNVSNWVVHICSFSPKLISENDMVWVIGETTWPDFIIIYSQAALPGQLLGTTLKVPLGEL